MEKMQEVVLSNSICNIATDRCKDYITHALCVDGSCTFNFNGNKFKFLKGDLIIIRKGSLVENVVTSADFKVRNICIKAGFVDSCTPQTNYGIIGQLHLFLNPVIHLDANQSAICERAFRDIEYRLGQTGHKFYREQVANAVTAALLDFFDFHSAMDVSHAISTQNASIMSRFLAMLENGTYRQHREVSFYADALCVTPKYLSEISKKVSGYAAYYWINRYTALDIARALRDKSLPFKQISDTFHFSSPAYFSRYVQRIFGVNPSKYRE